MTLKTGQLTFPINILANISRSEDNETIVLSVNRI